jgi:hypothetical protein
MIARRLASTHGHWFTEKSKLARATAPYCARVRADSLIEQDR